MVRVFGKNLGGGTEKNKFKTKQLFTVVKCKVQFSECS